MTAPRRSSTITVLLALLAAAVLPLLPAAAQPASFASCVERAGHVSALLLVDESQSLRQMDPDGGRVAGLRTAALALTRPGSAGDTTVSVQVAGFGTGFRTYGGWVDITDGVPGTLVSELEAFADRDDDLDTDYYEAFEGAAEVLDGRIHELGGETCTTVVWFTDGEYDLDSVQPRAYASDLDHTTPEGRDAIVARGEELLCEPGGLVDQLRGQGTAVYVVGLGLVEASHRRFLEAVATGTAEDTTCGDPDLAGDGLVVLVDGVDRLVDAFLDALGGGTATAQEDAIPVCDGEVCDLGTREFEVDAGVGAFALLLGADLPGVEAHVMAPDGDRAAVLELGTSGVAATGSATLTYDGLSDRVTVADVDLPDDDRSWAGTWRVTFVSPTDVGGTARLQVRVIPGFRADLATTELRRGDPVELTGTIVSRSGQPLPPELGGRVQLESRLVEPGGVGSVDLEVAGPDEAGAFVLRAGDLDLTTSSAEVVTTTTIVTESGFELVPVETVERVTLLTPLNYPIVPGELSFGVLEGTDPATADLQVTAADEAAGRVCVDALRISSKPETVTALGSDAVGDCLDVGAGTAATLPIDLEPASEGRGLVEGQVELLVTSATAEETVTVAVPFRSSMLPAVDEGVRLALIAAFLLLGLALPLVALWFVERWLTRLPESGEVMVIALPTRADGSGLSAPDGSSLASTLERRDLEARHLDHDGGREAEHRGLHLVARPRLVGFPRIEAAGTGGTMVLSGRSEAGAEDVASAALPLHLTGSWALLAGPHVPTDGELLLFTDAQPGWSDRAAELLATAERELPPLVAARAEAVPPEPVTVPSADGGETWLGGSGLGGTPDGGEASSSSRYDGDGWLDGAADADQGSSGTDPPGRGGRAASDDDGDSWL